MVFLIGFFNALGLIVAIGAQNAHVLRHGLLQRHVGTVVALCVLSDMVLIAVGAFGLGAMLAAAPTVSFVLGVIGVIFLWSYAALALGRAISGGQRLVPEAAAMPARAKSITTTLMMTWLNPAVYIDTVLVLGRLAESHAAHRGQFAAGAMLGSAVVFTGFGYGAKAVAPWLARAAAWRVIDILIALVMFAAGAHLIQRL